MLKTVFPVVGITRTNQPGMMNGTVLHLAFFISRARVHELVPSTRIEIGVTVFLLSLKIDIRIIIMDLTDAFQQAT